jgi:two-component system cell cycle sensor histidine kinase/response regulator CckA
MTEAAPSQREFAVLGMTAAGVAHDFNNLLVVILGAAEAILGRVEAGSATGADARQIRLAAERGAALVRQVLSLRDAGDASVPEGVAVGNALASLAPMLRYLLGPSVALSLEIEQPGAMVRLAAMPFERVILNLAANARNAMPGGGRLILRTRNLPEDEVLIEVEDTGAGIPSEIMPRLVEPFFTTRREHGGTGLGLATVQAILRKAGGRMAVDSTPGHGTRIQVFLPATADGTSPSPPQWGGEGRGEVGKTLRLRAPPCSAPPNPGPHNPRCVPHLTPTLSAPQGTHGGRRGSYVLVVEDEMPVRRLMERVLGRAGWVVRGFESAEAVPEGEQPAAVVSDLSLPGADGAQLIARLRQKWPALPAILVSGYTDSTIPGHLLREEVVFLAKPFTPADLLRALETCFAGETRGETGKTDLGETGLAKPG